MVARRLLVVLRKRLLDHLSRRFQGPAHISDSEAKSRSHGDATAREDDTRWWHDVHFTRRNVGWYTEEHLILKHLSYLNWSVGLFIGSKFNSTWNPTFYPITRSVQISYHTYHTYHILCTDIHMYHRWMVWFYSYHTSVQAIAYVGIVGWLDGLDRPECPPGKL